MGKQDKKILDERLCHQQKHSNREIQRTEGSGASHDPWWPLH